MERDKVSQITGRMAEVDSNLNYLLGRLSLVTQEFNQIKHGLGSALDNIRSSFQLVQNQIQGKPVLHHIYSLLFFSCNFPFRSSRTGAT